MEIEGPHIRIRISGWIICIPVKLSREAYGRAFHNAIQKVRGQGPYDLVFANILAPPLVALAQDIKNSLRLEGVAILSGLLRTQERRVTAAYLSRGFVLERRIHRDAWSALVLRRKG